MFIFYLILINKYSYILIQNIEMIYRIDQQQQLSMPFTIKWNWLHGSNDHVVLCHKLNLKIDQLISDIS